MSRLYEWARAVFCLIVALTFFQTLLPDTATGKYVRFLFSLVILAAILEPLVAILTGKGGIFPP